MKQTKKQARAAWITANAQAIAAARKNDHSKCRGHCNNGAKCYSQSGGGWGYWVQAFNAARINCDARSYWSGSLPTPSTSIDAGIAKYIRDNAPVELL